jgi:microcin C transport system substrate-binding protein
VVAVEKIDDHTILVKAGSRKAKLDLLNTTELWPQPKHYYKMGPELGEAVQLGRGTHHRPLRDERREEGQVHHLQQAEGVVGKDDRYNQHRFNLDTIKVQVIRDHNIAFRHFLKGSWTPSR